jgi:hypothetical protein
LSAISSRPGRAASRFALDGLWRRLGIDTAIRALLATRRVDEAQAERVLFALVANRALAPSSKLAATRWIASDVAIDGLDGIHEDACYRAMDALLEVEAALAGKSMTRSPISSTSRSTCCFSTPPPPISNSTRPMRRWPATSADVVPPGQATGEELSAPAGFRSYGKFKDHRDDLPQVVVGMAVIRTGIPVRMWC